MSRPETTSFQTRHLPEITAFDDAVDELKRLEQAVGALPPAPSGLRAQLGLGLVRLVQRALFWYTPPVRAFNAQVRLALEEQAQLNLRLIRRAAGPSTGDPELPALRETVRHLVNALQAELPFCPAIADSDSWSSEVAAHLAARLRTQRGPALVWSPGTVDLLVQLGQHRFAAYGVDPDLNAARVCQAAGLLVFAESPLAHMKNLDSGFVAAIVCPRAASLPAPPHLQQWLTEALRVLRAGGAFALGAPQTLAGDYAALLRELGLSRVAVTTASEEDTIILASKG